MAARPTLPWPLPAVLAWAAGWLSWRACLGLGVDAAIALACGCCAATLLAWRCRGAWRRGIAALGFPLAAGLGGAAQGVAAAWWLLPLLPLLLVYPLRAWRDAPFFPTPPQGLQGLADIVGQPHHVLDAGCGMGHGLRELSGLWPQARLLGVEWSPLLALAARLRVPRARIRRADMWALSWAPFDLVYLFQRPESMASAWRKAQRDMPPGAWLVSLEFAVPGVEPAACLAGPNRRTVWIYRLQTVSSDSTAAPGGR
jgi:SAM-dependent methyltransferase